MDPINVSPIDVSIYTSTMDPMGYNERILSGSCEKMILQRKADCFWHTLEVTGSNSRVLAIESDGRQLFEPAHPIACEETSKPRCQGPVREYL